MFTHNGSKKPAVREYRCLGTHKDRPCDKLHFKAWVEVDAIVVQVKCVWCNEFMVKKFRPRRTEKCQSLNLT